MWAVGQGRGSYLGSIHLVFCVRPSHKSIGAAYRADSYLSMFVRGILIFNYHRSRPTAFQCYFVHCAGQEPWPSGSHGSLHDPSIQTNKKDRAMNGTHKD